MPVCQCVRSSDLVMPTVGRPTMRFTIAGSAVSLAPIHSRVLLRVFVSPRAPGFDRPVLAGVASSDIFGMGYNFQMIRSNAGTCSAQVVQLKALGDGTDKMFIRPSMGPHSSSWLDAELSVAAWLEAAGPEPTRVREVDVGPEASHIVSNDMMCRERIADPPPSFVVQGTPAAGPRRPFAGLN